MEKGEIILRKGGILSATTLVASYCIGISYFNLPIVSGIGGFFPAILMTLVVWAFSLSIGLIYIEVVLAHPDGANLISMSRHLLGKVWAYLLACIFAINLFTYLSAYEFFASRMISWFIFYALGITCPQALANLILLLLFGSLLFLGMRLSSRVNFILMIGLLLTLFFTVYDGHQAIVPKRLTQQNWIFIFFSMPIAYSSLSSAALMPSICTYLKRDRTKIRQALIYGTLLATLFYIVWQAFAIGSISRGANWIMYEQSLNIDTRFSLLDQFPSLTTVLNFMIFFSATTSMFALGTILIDFLSDGLKLLPEQRIGTKRFTIIFLSLALVFMGSTFAEYFLLGVAKYFSAFFGEIIINGVVPLWLVVQARYAHQLTTSPFLRGGRFTLLLLAIFIFFLVYMEGLQLIR